MTYVATSCCRIIIFSRACQAALIVVTTYVIPISCQSIDQAAQNNNKQRSTDNTKKAVLFVGIFGGFALAIIVITCIGIYMYLSWKSRAPNLQRTATQDTPKISIYNTEAVMNTLASISFENQPSRSDVTCAICLDNLAVGQKTSHLKCAHQFHSKCIKEWVRTKGGNEASCPLCKFQLHGQVKVS